MKRAIILIFPLLILQSTLPDLSQKTDLEKLGRGKITEKDNSIIKNIRLYTVSDYWITYEKDGSLHDKLKDEIEKIEFTDSEWGYLTITFEKGEPKFLREIKKSKK